MSGLRDLFRTKTEADRAELALHAAQCVVKAHQHLAGWLRPGMTLGRVDAEVASLLAKQGCVSAFKGYKAGRHPPVPSHACLSVNACVVHGTAASLDRPLQPGDLLKIDIGVRYKGMIGDAAWTYCFGEPTPLVRRLMDCGKESLRRGCAVLTPQHIWLDWARTVQGYVEGECGFHLVRGLGGHGYGHNKLHDAPFVSNVVPDSPGDWPEATERCAPGTLVAVEPMLCSGTSRTVSHGNAWPVFSADGSPTVHYEHDVLVTEVGPRILTHELDDLPDVIAC